MAKWQRSFFQPVLPLGEDGRRVTGSKEHIALSRMAGRRGNGPSEKTRKTHFLSGEGRKSRSLARAL